MDVGRTGFDGGRFAAPDGEFDSPRAPITREVLETLAKGARRVLDAHCVWNCSICGCEGEGITPCSSKGCKIEEAEEAGTE